MISLIIIAVLYFAIVILIAHIFAKKEYVWTKNTVSDLGAQQYKRRWIMQAGFFGYGILLTWAILSLSKIIIWDYLIVIYAISIFLTGIFCIKPFFKTKSYSITEDKIHTFFAQLAGYSFTLAILAYFIISQKIIHLIFLILVSLLSLSFGLAKNNKIKIGPGLIQKILYIVGLSWIIIAYT